MEREAYAVANVVAKAEEGRLAPAPIHTDVRHFDGARFRGCVDILTGGYPCQPFSLAGKRLGSADPRHLWPAIARIIGDMQPAWCFFENVRGHVRNGLLEVLSDLDGLGYDAEPGLFSAEEVGAPHRRERVYILARNAAHSLGLKLWDESGRGGWSCGPGADEPGDDGAEGSLADSDGVRERQSQGRVPDFGRWAGNGCPPLLEHSNGQGLALGASLRRDACPEHAAAFGTGGWPPEPDVGRVVDGCPNRVDRLRLLGNGVVPAQAAHAFRTLYRKLRGVAP